MVSTNMGTKQISLIVAAKRVINIPQIPKARKEVMVDWELEFKMLKNIKGILADYFIIKDIEEDLHRDTDFMCFIIGGSTVGVRLRRYYYYQKLPEEWRSKITNRKYLCYPREEFTIRSKRPSGVPTEIDKILNGTVNYFLYGFVDKVEAKIIQWFLGDLDIFRNINPNPVDERWNKNYDSQLYAYKIKSLPDSFLVDEFNLP